MKVKEIQMGKLSFTDVEKDWRPNPELYQRLASAKRTPEEAVAAIEKFVAGVRALREECGIVDLAISLSIPFDDPKSKKEPRKRVATHFTCGNFFDAAKLMGKHIDQVFSTVAKVNAD